MGFHLGRSTLFAHGVVGSAHITDSVLPNLHSDNRFAVAAGGGLDAGFSRWFAWRITGDYYRTSSHATSINLNQILNQIFNSNGRISTGPVIRF